MSDIKAKVQLQGPFFTLDPRRTMRQNILDFDNALAAYGEAKARSFLDARRGQIPGWTGFTRNRIIGRTRAEMARGGKVWQVTAVVSANTDGLSKKLAIRTKAAASVLESKFRIFRATTFAMRAKAKTVDLTKGLE